MFQEGKFLAEETRFKPLFSIGGYQCGYHLTLTLQLHRFVSAVLCRCLSWAWVSLKQTLTFRMLSGRCPDPLPIYIELFRFFPTSRLSIEVFAIFPIYIRWIEQVHRVFHKKVAETSLFSHLCLKVIFTHLMNIVSYICLFQSFKSLLSLWNPHFPSLSQGLFVCPIHSLSRMRDFFLSLSVG